MDPIAEDLEVWIDRSPRPADAQMALDEALFEKTRSDGKARVRFYQWAAPAVTIGYFDEYPKAEDRTVIRRITGGGLVEHGNDLTFCLTLPSSLTIARKTTSVRYQTIHRALEIALNQNGFDVFSNLNSVTSHGPCFATPVPWDLCNHAGDKIVGGAQRASRGNVIHQGSVQAGTWPLEPMSWLSDFTDILATFVTHPENSTLTALESRSQELQATKYQTKKWNQRT